MHRFQGRGSAADGQFLDGIFSHDKDVLRVFDRQQAALIFQQDDAFSPNAARGGKVFGRGKRAVRAVFRQGSPVHQAQHAAHFVVEFIRAIFAGFNFPLVGEGQIVFVVGILGFHVEAVGAGTEFQVQAVGDGLVRVVATAPVADDGAVKAPLTLEDIVQQVLVVAAVLVFVKVIGTHDGPGTAFLHGRFEGRQVDFIEGTVVHDHIGRMAVDFVVVQGIVLDADGHFVALDSLDVVHGHPSGQVRVFPHILEITAAQGVAQDVQAGCQQNIFVAVAGFLSDALAVQGGHFGVPGGCQAGQGREGGAGIVRMVSLAPFVPQHVGADAVGAVGGP